MAAKGEVKTYFGEVLIRDREEARQLIVRAVVAEGGLRSRAAKRLSVSRPYFENTVSKLGLQEVLKEITKRSRKFFRLPPIEAASRSEQ